MGYAIRSSNASGADQMLHDAGWRRIEYSSNTVMHAGPGGNVVRVDFTKKVYRPSSLIDGSQLVFEMAMLPLKRELESYRHLVDGWDGPGSRAPSKSALDTAFAFLASISLASRLPDIAIGTDGEVNVSWRGEGYFVDLSFYDGTSGSLLFRAATKEKIPSGIRSFDDLPIQAHSVILVA